MLNKFLTVLIISAFFVGSPIVAMMSEDDTNLSHPHHQSRIKFAVIGDYGTKSEGTTAVSNLVKSWDPDFILTTGDNNYGKAEDIDHNVGSIYSRYIYPYNGDYEKPSVTHSRFFPCLGNHDFQGRDATSYLNYFSLPGNGYYYDFVKGGIHFFSVCSDKRCPDGIAPDSKQMLWLKEKVQDSKIPWKLIYYHHPTYSSCVRSPGGGDWPVEYLEKNNERRIDLPFSDWGVSAVLSGHLHLYERFDVKGIPYIINGLGGDERYKFVDDHPDPESIVRFSDEDGAMLIEASDTELAFRFVTTSGKIIDEVLLKK